MQQYQQQFEDEKYTPVSLIDRFLQTTKIVKLGNKSVHIIGILFVIILLVYTLLATLLCVFNLFPAIFYVYSEIISVPIIFFGFFILYSFIYNFLRSIFQHPGQIYYDKSQRLHQLNTLLEKYSIKPCSSDPSSRQISPELTLLLKNGQKTAQDLEYMMWERMCPDCKRPKSKNSSFLDKKTSILPLLTAHCDICNKCSLRMDHHCPWILNCVGNNNRRFFLLFLWYAWVSAIYLFFITQLAQKNERMYEEYRGSIRFTRALGVSVGIVLFFFNGWNWYISIFKGKTVQDFIDEDHVKFQIPQLKLWRENLFSIFGTFSLLAAMMMPVKRVLPLTGIQFTFAAIQKDKYSFNSKNEMNLL